MCIRDRGISVAFAIALHNIPEGIAIAMPIYFSTGSRYKACLLYTSDAADDLLCVDLGGRRIIKKKNSNYK